MNRIILKDGTLLHSQKIDTPTLVAMMVDAESGLGTYRIARKYGISWTVAARLWDAVYLAGGVRGYHLNLRDRLAA